MAQDGQGYSVILEVKSNNHTSMYLIPATLHPLQQQRRGSTIFHQYVEVQAKYIKPKLGSNIIE